MSAAGGVASCASGHEPQRRPATLKPPTVPAAVTPQNASPSRALPFSSLHVRCVQDLRPRAHPYAQRRLALGPGVLPDGDPGRANGRGASPDLQDAPPAGARLPGRRPRCSRGAAGGSLYTDGYTVTHPTEYKRLRAALPRSALRRGMPRFELTRA
jgi:hypothetical protein